MRKPKKPTKKILIDRYQTYFFDGRTNKSSWKSFQDWIKQTVPKGAMDVFIGLDHDYDDWSGDILCSNICIEWKEKVDNTNYTNDMKKYEKKLAKWKKEQ